MNKQKKINEWYQMLPMVNPPLTKNKNSLLVCPFLEGNNKIHISMSTNCKHHYTDGGNLAIYFKMLQGKSEKTQIT